MNIFVSTGGFKNTCILTLGRSLQDKGFSALEFSGGSFEVGVLDKLISVEALGLEVQIHNYFPVPQKPFVLNIASSNDYIRERSRLHIQESIKIAAKLQTKRYSFHAGFFVDPDPSLLGRAWSGLAVENSNSERFISEVKSLAIFAKQLGVDLYVENNVVIDSNIRNNKCLLMGCSMDEMLALRNTCGVKLLIDVGHLVVSARTLGLREDLQLEISKAEADAYHISDNNRLRDENKRIVQGSSILRGVGMNKDFYTLEVYDDLDAIKNSVEALTVHLAD